VVHSFPGWTDFGGDSGDSGSRALTSFRLGLAKFHQSGGGHRFLLPRQVDPTNVLFELGFHSFERGEVAKKGAWNLTGGNSIARTGELPPEVVEVLHRTKATFTSDEEGGVPFFPDNYRMEKTSLLDGVREVVEFIRLELSPLTVWRGGYLACREEVESHEIPFVGKKRGRSKPPPRIKLG